jgi:hypothetical protein
MLSINQRDKNKELEARNKVLEKKYHEERRYREQCENKMKQMKKKICVLTKVLAESNGRSQFVPNGTSGSGAGAGSYRKQNHHCEDESLCSVDTIQTESSVDALRIPEDQSIIEEKCTSSDSEIKESKTLPKSPTKHRKTMSMANPAPSLHTVASSRRRLKLDDLDQPATATTTPNQQDEHRSSHKTESHARPPLPNRANKPDVGNNDKNSTFGELDQMARELANEGSKCSDSEQSDNDTEHNSKQKEKPITDVAAEPNNDTAQKPPHVGENDTSTRADQQIHSQSVNQLLPTGTIMHPSELVHNGETAFFIAPSGFSMQPVLYQQHGLEQHQDQQPRQNFTVGVENFSQSMHQQAGQSRGTSSMTFITTNAGNDFMNQGFLLQSGPQFIQQPTMVSRSASHTGISQFDPMAISHLSERSSESNQQHVTTQQVFVSHNATEQSTMVKQVSDPGGIFFMNGNDVQQMQFLAHTQHTRDVSALGDPDVNDTSVIGHGGEQMNSSNDPFAELARRRPNKNPENQNDGF